MTTNYPGSLDDGDTVGGGAVPASTDALNATPSHSDRHQDLADAVIAAETKVGTGSSTPTTGAVLIGTGSGTSAWDTSPDIAATTLGSAGVGKTAWTPQLYQGGNVTSTNTESSYTRMGDLFVCLFNIAATAAGTGANKFEIRDLPSTPLMNSVSGSFAFTPTGGTPQPGTLTEGAADGVYFVGADGNKFGDYLGTATHNLTIASGDVFRGVIFYWAGS